MLDRFFLLCLWIIFTMALNSTNLIDLLFNGLFLSNSTNLIEFLFSLFFTKFFTFIRFLLLCMCLGNFN